MTESEWLQCSDPKPMLEYLRGRASERKLRLLAVACCRGVWQWMTDRRSRLGVRAAEGYADGLVDEEELASAREGTAGAWTTVWGDGWHIYQSARAAHFTCCAEDDTLLLVPDEARNAVRNFIPRDPVRKESEEAVSAEVLRQASLLRCIFGNLFRIRPLDPAWLTWGGGTIQKLARAAYDERSTPEGTLDPTRLAVLADALEDAGCDNADILSHCRGPGPHVRGCWVLDLILGKE